MPDLDPDTLARIAKSVSDLYSDATAQLLQAVAQRMARGIDDPGWAEQKLLEIVGLRSDAADIVRHLQEDGPPAVRKAIEDAAEAGAKAARSELRLTLAPKTNTAAVEKLVTETVSKVRQVNGGILRGVDDVYRSVIAETSAPGVVTGTETRRQAAQRALNRFADRGITGFRDSAGRDWSMESYTEMATRTSSGRAMISARIDAYQGNGHDFVIVSDSGGECPLCEPYEGQGLSLTGEGVGETVGGFDIIDTLDNAQAEGLMHPNCTHDVQPIIPGLTKKFGTTADPEGFKARQEQRRLERGVRQWKGRAAVALDDDTRKAAEANARAWQQRLRDHVQDNDLKRQPAREQIGRAR